jgi:hypothetical protein
MALEHVPRCQHVKVNGVQCGSPALRNKAHCFFHHRAEHERKLACEDRSGKRTFGFPLLEDANAIQVALMKVLQWVGAGTIDHKSASLMLYGLQTASYNLRMTKFEPEKATEVVIDEDTVDLTRIQGPQWSSRDFPPSPPREVDDMMRDDEVEDPTPGDEILENDQLQEEEYMPEMPPVSPIPAPAAVNVKPTANSNAPRAAAARKPAAAPMDPALADVVRRRDQKRNLKFDVDQAIRDQPDSLAAVLLQRMGLPLEIEDTEEERREKQRTGTPS